MAASTSQAGRLLQSDSPFSTGTKVAPTPVTVTDGTQNARAPQNFVNFSVLCMHDFNPEDAGLLSFRKNDILDVIKRDESGWWAAIRQDGPTGPLVGWIPQAYVSVLSEEMTMKLRSKRNHLGKRDRNVAVNANLTADVDGSSAIFEDDSPSRVSLFSQHLVR
jgi:son of sevenless-like protein